jgi:hypothetical protein
VRVLRTSFYYGLFLGLVTWVISNGSCVSLDLGAPQVWLSGVDPFVRKAMKEAGPSDYDELFLPDAPWRVTATDVRVFKTSTQWILNGPDKALARMFKYLQDRGIALAVEGLMLTLDNNDRCGHGIEGYSALGTIRHAAEQIKNLGGELSYIAMDEPLWFGHSYRGTHACQSSLSNLAQNIAQNVNQVKQIFPDVQIGDIEPILKSSEVDWVGTIVRWTAEYEKAIGRPLAFLHADIDWALEWRPDLSRLKRELGARGIKFGIIYNGNPGDPTDQDWTKAAEDHFDEVEGRLGIIPDHATLQTWMVHPSHMLPEDSPGTMTNLVGRYSRKRTSLSLQQSDGRLLGTLTDTEQHPISNTMISIMVLEDGRTGLLTGHDWIGTVPQTAYSANIGLRLNTECDCSGDGEVGVGTITYSDDGGSLATRRFPNANAATSNGLEPNAPTQFVATAGRPTISNSQSFPVSSGRNYRIKVPMRATPEAAGAGYICLIFFGRDGKEMRRDRIPISQGESRRVTIPTDQNGTFQYDGTDVLPNAIEVVFDGDKNYRAVRAHLK